MSSRLLQDIWAASNTNGQVSRSVAIWNSSKLKGIFHLDGFPINGTQVTSWLVHLNLVNLPELRYIWKGANHFVTLQNLSLLYIWGCQKLKAIFSPCVLRSLPQLEILVVLQCDELEQIIEEYEENEIVSDPQAAKVCFSKLKLLLVTHCNKLKRLFYLSTPHEFPELEYLIIYQNPQLEEVFEECEQVARERRVEVSLPELKHVVLMQLPNLNNISQWIEFKGVTNLLVHNCPKLSLTARTTAEDMLRSHCHGTQYTLFFLPRRECYFLMFWPCHHVHNSYNYVVSGKIIDVFVRSHLVHISNIINEEKKDGMPETTCQFQMNPQPASGSEVPSLTQVHIKYLYFFFSLHKYIVTGLTN